jgi:RNA methyltransferase, TrmH family
VEAAAAAGVPPVDLLRAGVDVEPRLLTEVATAAHPPRVIGVYRRDDLPRGPVPPVALELHGVSDPGNVGTLIRTAHAFGAGVVLASGCADPTSPKSLRASTGSIWRVPQLDELDGRRVGLVAHGGKPLDELDLTGAVVFLLGAEREGLPSDLERDVDATIPLAGAESLNVAAAGAIALYEWRRQNA